VGYEVPVVPATPAGSEFQCFVLFCVDTNKDGKEPKVYVPPAHLLGRLCCLVSIGFHVVKRQPEGLSWQGCSSVYSRLVIVIPQL
jgi:hypothetical protein